MVNFDYLIVENSGGFNVFNLANCRGWSINVTSVVRDDVNTIFTVELAVDGIVFPVKHKIAGNISKEVYLNILDNVLDGRNNVQFLGLQAEVDGGFKLIIKSNYYLQEYMVTTNHFSITGKPIRPNRDKTKDVFGDVEIKSVDEEDLF